MTGTTPAGRLVELRRGGDRAVVATGGATLRVLELGGVEAIEPFAGPRALAVGCQGELLAPWPGRVVDARFAWAGEEHALSVTEPARGHALHGLVRGLAWDVVERRSDRVVLDVLLLAQPGWPYPLQLEASYALGPDGLVAAISARNVGASPCPCGLGAHPYLSLRGTPLAEAVLDLPAATSYGVDARLAPTGRVAVAGTPLAFTAAAPIGERRADQAYTDLPRAPDGRVAARLVTADGLETVIWGDGAVGFWQLFTSDTLAAPWRRRAVAVEPMTCAPDALNSRDGLVVLAPGERLSMGYGIVVRSARKHA